MKKLIVSLAVTLFMRTVSAQTTWTIDKEHSSINFTVSHFVVGQTAGRFKDFDAKVLCKTDDFNGAVVSFTAKTASVDTDNDQRDHHLQSDDFLNAQKYPEMTFAGTLVNEAGKYFIKGSLTIRDITQTVVFAVTYNGRLKESTFNVDKAGFTITGSLSRQAYGLKWNETFEGGGAIVGDQVNLNLNIEINREK